MNFECWAAGTWAAGSWVEGSWCPGPPVGGDGKPWWWRIPVRGMPDDDEEALLAWFTLEEL